MFYDADANDHGLPFNPFKAIAVPRPIGWVSTISRDGHVNLAPYSFFNAMSERPHYVAFGSLGIKDTLANLNETGEFVCSLANWDMREQQNVTSAPVPRDVDEFEVAGLKAVTSTKVKPPRVAGAPAAFECELWKMFDLPPGVPGGNAGYTMVVGHVVGIYIDDAYMTDGIVDTAAMQPIARLGYMDYAVVKPESTFTIQRPDANPDGKTAKS